MADEVKSVLKDIEKEMEKSVEAMEADFQTIRTGRASPALVEKLPVEYYGSHVPLQQLATINVPEPQVIMIKPFDPTTLKLIVGLLRPSRGTVLFQGAPLDVEARAAIGFLPEQPYFYDYLTVEETLTFFARLYRRSSKEISFVRTGFGGQKVIVNGGALVFPVLHETIPVNMNTLRLEVRRANEAALITKDRMRVDVQAEFYVRVQPTTESIANAAQTTDHDAVKVCHDIARAIEEQLNYPGEIKVTVVRETRAVEFAR